MFFTEAITTIKQSGTVAPSSSFLVRKMIEPINFNKKNVIVEFGTGNGCITNVLLERLGRNSKIYSFELNENFFSQCLRKLPKDNRLHILNQSALAFDEILKERGIEKVDYFVSSLPLSLFDEKDIDLLLSKINSTMKPNGKFIQFQYSLGKYNVIKKKFPKINLDFTLFNLPPAFIYSCQKIPLQY